MIKSLEPMTDLGKYLERKSVSKAGIAKKTGISKSRLSQLTNNESTQLKVWELNLIALAIDVDPCEIIKEVCKGLKLEN